MFYLTLGSITVRCLLLASAYVLTSPVLSATVCEQFNKDVNAELKAWCRTLQNGYDIKDKVATRAEGTEPPGLLVCSAISAKAEYMPLLGPSNPIRDMFTQTCARIPIKTLFLTGTHPDPIHSRMNK